MNVATRLLTVGIAYFTVFYAGETMKREGLRILEDKKRNSGDRAIAGCVLYISGAITQVIPDVVLGIHRCYFPHHCHWSHSLCCHHWCCW